MTDIKLPESILLAAGGWGERAQYVNLTHDPSHNNFEKQFASSELSVGHTKHVCKKIEQKYNLALR